MRYKTSGKVKTKVSSLDNNLNNIDNDFEEVKDLFSTYRQNIRNVRVLIKSIDKLPEVISFFESFKEMTCNDEIAFKSITSANREDRPLQCSRSLNIENNISCDKTIGNKTEQQKDTEHFILPQNFLRYKCLTNRNTINNITNDHDEIIINESNLVSKNTRLPLSSVDNAVISTETFYSGSVKKSEIPVYISKFHVVNPYKESFLEKENNRTKRNGDINRSLRQNGLSGLSLYHVNKGVGHKIRKRNTHTVLSSSIKRRPELDTLLCTLRSEKLRSIIIDRHQHRQHMDTLSRIFSNTDNPIAMARPLRLNINDDECNKLTNEQTDFSDIDCNDDMLDDDDQENCLKKFVTVRDSMTLSTDILEETKSHNRKFFKSDRGNNIQKEIKLTPNIKATFNMKGKLILKPYKKRKTLGMKHSTDKFCKERAMVDDIIQKLDDSTYGEMPINNNDFNKQSDDKSDILFDQASNDNYFDLISKNQISDFKKFRERLPYNTTCPITIKHQQILLEFLISNNICTEENFTIFIAEPNKYHTEAERIINELLLISKETKESEEEEKKENPADINTETIQIGATMKKKISNDCKVFPIFDKMNRYQSLMLPSKKRRIEGSNIYGYGANQYQIDAGQKQFGATECKQCGLLYSIHEPEEEKIHREYHDSLHVLRFNGWLDEDVVAIYPEWGLYGRILRLTENMSAKRLERFKNILKIVDKEIGCEFFELPKTFIAFLAVRQMQIVGLCLVHPLKKAHRYIQVNGVDCCTSEEFDTICGISRIWVSPPHRGIQIGRKLIDTIQRHTIPGKIIAIDEIAFSVPTEMGKRFAQNITKTENFLIYQ